MSHMSQYLDNISSLVHNDFQLHLRLYMEIDRIRKENETLKTTINDQNCMIDVLEMDVQGLHQKLSWTKQLLEEMSKSIDDRNKMIDDRNAAIRDRDMIIIDLRK